MMVEPGAQMPLLTVSLTARTFDEISRLVEKGLYSGLDQFLEIAALNQLALERGVSPEELKETGHRERREPPERSNTRDLRRATAEPSKPPTPPKRTSAASMEPAGSRAPAARKHSRSSKVPDGDSQQLRERTALTSWGNGGPQPLTPRTRPADERLWGQVNRLFPLKFVARWLAIMSAPGSAWPKVEITAPDITFDAATLGTLLELDDAENGRKRDEQFATGLPRRGNPASLDRFQSQFVARTTRSGEIYPGAICQYGLAAFDGDALGLTEAGVELARMANPLLDGDASTAKGTLSDDERNLFISVVQKYVPGERHEFHTVLSAVASGNDKPEDLLLAMQPVLPQHWSEVQSRTHVSGVVARLTELGLLTRHWEGRHVRYEPTASASSFLTTPDPEVRDAH